MRVVSAVVATGAVAVVVAAAVSADEPPPACAAATHRQFDFWIGDWKVYDPSGKVLGENRIESFAGGCALLENWTGASGFTGKSFNIYDRNDGKWHQSWVDSVGGRLELVGGLANDRMILAGETRDRAKPDVIVTQRITWSVNDDRSVRQVWESSEDGGKTWTVAFDGKYVRK